jgi:peptidyl-tRNA hydrolase
VQKHHTVQKYVVSNFTTGEEGDLRKLIKHTSNAIETALHKGLDKAMNEYN